MGLGRTGRGRPPERGRGRAFETHHRPRAQGPPQKVQDKSRPKGPGAVHLRPLCAETHQHPGGGELIDPIGQLFPAPHGGNVGGAAQSVPSQPAQESKSEQQEGEQQEQTGHAHVTAPEGW